MSSETPRIGVAIFVIRPNGKFITGQRKGSHGTGTMALPGGHLEFGESFEDCARRELLEETGVEVNEVAFLTAVNTVFGEEGKHYVTIFMGGQVNEGVEPQLLEPEKCAGWEWVAWEEMASWARENAKVVRPLFKPMISLMQQRQGFDPVVLTIEALKIPNGDH